MNGIRQMKVDAYAEMYLWRRNFDRLLRVLQPLETFSICSKQEMKVHEVGLEEIGDGLNADFAEAMATRVLNDESRLGRRPTAGKEILRWRAEVVLAAKVNALAVVNKSYLGCRHRLISMDSQKAVWTDIALVVRVDCEAQVREHRMGEWKAQIALRVWQPLRAELEESAARERRRLGNIADVILGCGFEQLKATDSAERLLKYKIRLPETPSRRRELPK